MSDVVKETEKEVVAEAETVPASDEMEAEDCSNETPLHSRLYILFVLLIFLHLTICFLHFVVISV